MSHPSRRFALRSATVLAAAGPAALAHLTTRPGTRGGAGLLVGALGAGAGGGTVPSNRRKR